MDPGGKRESGMGVPEIMQADDRHPGLLHRRLEEAASPFGVQWLSFIIREDEIRGFKPLPEFG
jgi:hypothetical protein